MKNQFLNNKLLVTLSLTSYMVMTLSACSDSISGQQSDSQLELDLIKSVNDNVYTPAVNTFAEQTSSLVASVQNYCSDVADNQSHTDSLTAAQASWTEATNNWQSLELMQVAQVSSYRNSIYSGPSNNQCAVDQDVVNFESNPDYNITARSNSRRGLDALEYLLFNQNLDHSCPTEAAPDGWNTRTEQNRRLARCQFAVEVAQDIQSSTNQLQQVWANSNVFTEFLAQVNNTNNVFDDANEAVNTIADALFYIDTITKDMKLAKPVGLKANSCQSSACTDDLESEFARHSLENIKTNLIALQTVFYGGTNSAEATGFDDYLIAANATDLVTNMNTDIQTAIAACDDFEGSMFDSVTNNPQQIIDLHTKVKAVTDNLKVAFISVLQLAQTGAGDGD